MILAWDCPFKYGYNAAQSKNVVSLQMNAVIAYFTSKQLLHFSFAE